MIQPIMDVNNFNLINEWFYLAEETKLWELKGCTSHGRVVIVGKLVLIFFVS